MTENFKPTKAANSVNSLETSLVQADGQGDVQDPANEDPSGWLYESSQADIQPGGKPAAGAGKGDVVTEGAKSVPDAAKAVPDANKALPEVANVDSGLSMGDVAMAGALIVGGAIASRTPIGRSLYMAGEKAVGSLATKVTGLGDVTRQASVLSKFGDSFPTLSTGLEGVNKLAVNRLSTLQGGGRAFLHGDGTVVARADEVVPLYGGKVSGIEAINPAGHALKILKANGEEAGSLMLAEAKSPGIKGFNMELRSSSMTGDFLTLKRGDRTITGNAEGIVADSNTFFKTGKEFEPHLWRRAWTEAQTASTQLRNSITRTPTLGA